MLRIVSKDPEKISHVKAAHGTILCAAYCMLT